MEIKQNSPPAPASTPDLENTEEIQEKWGENTEKIMR